MALKVTLDKDTWQPYGHAVEVTGTIDFDSSYPKGGESFKPADLGLRQIDSILFDDRNGIGFDYDYTNNKVRAIPGARHTVLTINTTAVGNVGTGEDDLMTFTLKGATLGTNGMGVRATGWGTAANNANAKTVKGIFGTTTLLTTALTASQAGVWRAVMEIIRTGAATQEVGAHLLQGGATTIVDVEQSAPAETLANDLTIKFTGTGTADNDIVQEGMIVEWFVPEGTGTVGAEAMDTSDLSGLTGVRFRARGV
jgi:hypothetical protein